MQAAQELLSNSLLRESISAVEAALLKQMHQVKLDDVAGHTRLIVALQVSQAVNRHLWHVMQDGAAAQQEISLRGRRID